ncbi:hypothetical protein Dsin_000877 [Dipteronia sinensis]|uniref:Protein NRT1/ PTR FAMILY 4.5-like n=1 Tax=Dipteronia sinensis TaxID=43782 RepID=A0AAE0EHX4_9ROSI|nr:hypothetical protein Dsin_000877 [Dipteronia sinensis]
MEEEDQAKTNIGGYNGRKGGFRACKFVFVLMFLENMGFVANMVSLVLYFMYVMNFNVAGAANTLTNLMGSTFLLSIVGGFISDTYLTRLQTALVFGSIEIMGLVLLTVQAHEKNLHPKKESRVEGGIAMMFYTSLSLLALGSGGVRGSLAPLGADQFDQKNPKEAKALASFFNYMLLSITLGAVIGVTVIVYVSTVKSWFWGFFISTVTASLGFVALAVGKPFYRIQPLSQSPLIRIAQVIVVAFKNRKFSMPENPEELYEIDEKYRVSTEERILHTNQFRWLDRAAIVSTDTEPEQWKICTVTQVEEVKILARMLPILGSTVVMNTCMAQLQTFSIEQGNAMDPKLGSFKVPAASIPVIPLAFMSILVPLYEMFFVPFARKITKHPSGISQLQRVGVGLVLSAISMAVAGFIEVKRRNQSNKNIMKPISLFWLSFQYGIFGIADMFTLVGLLEFFYKEAPLGMRSLSTSFTWLSLSFGYFLSSAFVSIINSVTKKVAPSKQGWLHGLDINKNNVNLFYWFLAIISVLNFFVYLYSANWYKYKPENIPDDIAAASKSSYSEQPKSVILESKEEKVQESTTEDQKTT